MRDLQPATSHRRQASGVVLIDVHAHLSAEDFATDLEAVLQEAATSGVERVLAVGETLEDAERNLQVAERYPLVKPCAGLHPTILDPDQAEALIEFIQKHRDRLVAIGEVGLDYWVVQDEADQEVQRKILARFIALSNDLDLPLNVHSRSAGRSTIAFLKEHGARHVLLHAFDGKASTALEGIAEGYGFSIPPSVVRSPQKQKLVRRLPMESLLLESDAPVLGPDPSLRNEPKNVAIACQAIAQLKGISPEEVAAITTENARRLIARAFS